MDVQERSDGSIGSVVFAALLWLLAAYIFVGAFGFSYPANVAPLILGGLATAFMTGLLVREAIQLHGRRVGTDRNGRTHELSALACAIGSIALVMLLGFLVGMSIAMVGLLRMYARERWSTALAVAAGVLLTLYLGFGVALNVSFYPGLLGIWD